MKLYSLNTLCWYPFKKGSSIIQISDSKTSLFLKDIKNISIDDIKQIKKKYDYVLLIENDINDFRLLDVTKLIKEDGHILLIEPNHLFIYKLSKHFNLGYTIADVDKFIKKLKLKYSKYYYPYPNYNHIQHVFTDESFKSRNYPIYLNFEEDIVYDFDENYLIDELNRNNIIKYFVHSFIVDISNEKVDNNVDYVKVSAERDEKFQIYTVIDYKHKLAKKYPLTIKAKKHIDDITNYKFKIGKFKNLDVQKKENFVYSKLLEYKSLRDLVNKDNIEKYIKIYVDNLFIDEVKEYQYDKRFVTVFGSKKTKQKLHWHKDVNIDLVLDNVFVLKDSYLVIDPEWSFDFYIPLEYVIYRTIKYARLDLDVNVINNLYKMIGIDEQTINIFEEWEHHFIYDYVGTEIPEIKKKINTDYYDQYSVLNNELDQIKNSMSWKITKPIRVVLDLIKKVLNK